MRFYNGLLRIIFLLVAGVASTHAAEEPVVKWQEISVYLEPERHLVLGQSSIGFAAGTRGVSLRLSSSAQVEAVQVAGKATPFSFAAGLLSLDLPKGSETTAVTISYRASFNDPVSSHPAASEDPSYGVNAAVTKEGTFLGGGSYWYPVPAQVPLNRKITISAPAGIEGVTVGARIARETGGGVTRSVWQEARPVGVPSLCAGPYLIQERQAAGIKLYSYFYRENAHLAARYLDGAAKYLALYQDLFGPYPFEKFAVVENFFPTGYGFPSFTLLGGSVIRLPFIVDTSLPHEIAHSWWGNGVDVDPSEGNWCEGLVTYLADYLLKERRSPAEALEYRKQLLIDYASLVSPENDFPLTGFLSRNDPASRAIGYGKGAMVFHMIRSEIGDGPFFAALRDLSRDRMYRSASWSDLLRAFSRSAGKDLAPLFSNWIHTTGGPRLSLASVSSRREADGWLVAGSIKQAARLFEVGVPLRLQTADGTVEKVVQVPAQGVTNFAIWSRSVPQKLLLDPEAAIFRVLAQGEIPATVNSIKGAGSLVGVITENCQAQPTTFKALLASLSQEKASIVREAQLDQAKIAGNDLVFCGTPSNLSLLPDFPADVDLSGGSFQGAQAASPGDGLLFLVLRRSAPSRRIVALFQPLSEAAARQYGPKITHYGKYGHLVFSGGSNRYKATILTADQGVVVPLVQGASH